MNESLSSSEVPLPSGASEQHLAQPNPASNADLTATNAQIPIQDAAVDLADMQFAYEPQPAQPAVAYNATVVPSQYVPEPFHPSANETVPTFQPVIVQETPSFQQEQESPASYVPAAVPQVDASTIAVDAQETQPPADVQTQATVSAELPQTANPPAFFNAQSTADEIEDDVDDMFDIEDDDEEPSAYSYMQNRELSWLTFNERVLDQGADESVPLLERLNFISIFWSNLREFFMVRVGSLTDLALIQPPVKDSKTGWTPTEQIAAIHERCRELYPIQESYYEHVRGSLAKEGVRHLRPDDLSDEQRNYLSGFMKFNIEPFLSPQIINPRHPFPHLENGKLYILVRLYDEIEDDEEKLDKKKKKKAKKKAKGGAEGVVLGLIPLPHQCERVIKLPGRGFQFILLEHAIEMFVPDIFSMYSIKHTNVICVTRNADIDANQTGDEQDEDYREHMKRLLKQRARLAPVRLECERPLSPVMEKLMLQRLGLKREQVYDTIVPLDLSFTWDLGSRLTDKKRAKLSNPPFTPAWPVVFDRKRRILDQVGEKEVLLSYPYESMDPFVQLLKEAAFDPSVISIKITLYRLASQSQLAEALITAAENGKEVTALFELRARFDESNNIEWSQRFEQAGCNVIYGFRDYKVHSKICCITRRMPDGSIQRITQLGTGNYNEKTAKLYTDLSFITTDETFGADAVEFFRNMQLENVSDNYNVLCVAPLQIKPMILKNLDNQIELARQGKPCGAFLKANSVTDKDVMEKIAEASQAGVHVTLFVRGICCLVPKVKGATDNVNVVSIVGRLLEHSRIYCFGTPDDCTMYLSSADLMTRNLNKRVEIAWPILNAKIRARILEYMNICLHDTAKLRELRPNKTYTPLGAFCDIDDEGNAQPAFDAQNALIERAQLRLARMEAAQEQAASAADQPQAAPQPHMMPDVTPIQAQPVFHAQVQPVFAGQRQGIAAEQAQPDFAMQPQANVQQQPATNMAYSMQGADQLQFSAQPGFVQQQVDFAPQDPALSVAMDAAQSHAANAWPTGSDVEPQTVMNSEPIPQAQPDMQPQMFPQVQPTLQPEPVTQVQSTYDMPATAIGIQAQTQPEVHYHDVGFTDSHAALTNLPSTLTGADAAEIAMPTMPSFMQAVINEQARAADQNAYAQQPPAQQQPVQSEPAFQQYAQINFAEQQPDEQPAQQEIDQHQASQAQVQQQPLTDFSIADIFAFNPTQGAPTNVQPQAQRTYASQPYAQASAYDQQTAQQVPQAQQQFGFQAQPSAAMTSMLPTVNPTPSDEPIRVELGNATADEPLRIQVGDFPTAASNPAAQRTPETETTAPPQPTETMPVQTRESNEAPSFLDEAHRELEMPPSKGGFFSRFRKKK